LALRGTEEERNAGDPLAQSRNRGRFSFESMKMHGIVGWAKALARNFPTAKTLVRRAHAVIIRNCARPRGHGARSALPRATAVPTLLPTLRFRFSAPCSTAEDERCARRRRHAAPPRFPRSRSSDAYGFRAGYGRHIRRRYRARGAARRPGSRSPP